MCALDLFRLTANADRVAKGKLIVAQLIEHYKSTELGTNSGKTTRTKQVYEHQLTNVISPRWGSVLLENVKAIEVERWLSDLPLAPGSKAKTKGVFSVLFQHAMRYEWAATNPIRLVRQSGVTIRNHDVLTPAEVWALVSELRDPFRCIVFAAVVTGLRRGELFGLKWRDINFDSAEIRIVRSVVDQVEGPPKTLASRRPLPLCKELARAFLAWKSCSRFSGDDDWVFASPQAIGRRPYWPDAVLKRHVRPAARRACVYKQISWHTFRRTLATMLLSHGSSVKVTQDLMRHASAVLTVGTYAQAVTAEKREAQDAIARLLGDPKSAEAA